MNPNSLLYGILAGQVIDSKYHLETMLGTGGFGAVFRTNEVVRDRVLRQLAVKIIAPSGNPEQQLGELIAATNLDHPHFIRSLAAGEYNFMNISFLYLVMELAEYSLERQLERGTLKGDALKQAIVQIATALDYLHSEKKQVHRDLKPGNVLWVKNCWKISDFGTVRQLNTQSYLHTANPIGTIPYMPPEAFQDGTVSPAGDMWSLGITIVVALTGKLPYQFSQPTELLERVINYRLEIPSLAPEFDGIVRGCLQRDWRQRWTAKQLLAALDGRSSPAGSRVAPSPGASSSYREQLPNGVALEMIAIPAGSFLMGTPSDDVRKILAIGGYSKENIEQWIKYEMPQHRATVLELAMGKYPITQEQWQAVMGNNPSRFSGVTYPVESVNWKDAKEFCSRLSKLTGKTYRLPTEAEWEYAARAGSQNLYSFGDNANQLKDYAWYGDNSSGQTQPVGKKKANAFGIYDMHGNVWEWCEDEWHENYNGAPVDGSAWVNNNSSQYRLLRGGSWYYNAYYCRSAFRYRYDADYRYYVIGFRVVCS